MVFVKNGHFSLFVFLQNKTKKTNSHYSGQKIMFFRQEKLSFEKLKKFEIFQRG